MRKFGKNFDLKLIVFIVVFSIDPSYEEDLNPCICPTKNETELLQSHYNYLKVLKEAHEDLLDDIITLNESIQDLNPPPEIANVTCENSTPKSCYAFKHNGIQKIQLERFSNKPLYVYCKSTESSGGWVVVLRRQDGSVSFEKNIVEYKEGFGSLNGEFFIGLDNLHMLTRNSIHELLVVIEHINGTRTNAKYKTFAIENEQENYRLSVLGEYSGDAGNQLIHHQGMEFYAIGQDHSCVTTFKCGWWWSTPCYEAFLTGPYTAKEVENDKVLSWGKVPKKRRAPKFVEMLIRPQKK